MEMHVSGLQIEVSVLTASLNVGMDVTNGTLLI